MSFEFRILDAIQLLHTPFLDAVMKVITSLGNAGIIWILLAACMLAMKKTRRTGFILAAALLADLILCNGIVKNLAARVRPYDVNTAVQLLITAPTDYSFPSGHTAASFASASALYASGRRKAAKAALVLAVLIAFSRLYFYVHYPTDILGGILLGSFCGWLGYKAVCLAEERQIFKIK